jgi:uncharacterized protein YcnI
MILDLSHSRRALHARLSRGVCRLSLAAFGASLAALLTLDVASAHVTVNPREAAPDSSQTFNVRVPTEKDEPTVKIRVEFPAGLADSRFQPKPGWTREVERDAQQRITAVTWSGSQIGPGEYDEFAFIARTPKDAGALSFKAYQTYQGGETVEWTGAEGSERPAALVAVKGAPAASAAGASESHGDGTAAQAAGKAAGAPATDADGASRAPVGTSGSDLSLFAALATGVLALIAIVLSGIALARRPRPA